MPGSSSAATKPWVLASAGEDVRVWQNEAGAQVPPEPAILQPHGQYATNCVQWDHTGGMLGSCGDDGCVRVSSVLQQEVVTLQPEEGALAPVNCFSFSSGSGYVCSGAADGVVRVWDMKQRRTVQRYDDHHGCAVTSISFSANDAHIVSGDAEGQVLIHGLVDQNLSATLPRPDEDRAPVRHLEFSRLRKSLLGTAMAHGTVHVWDINAATRPLVSFTQHTAACTGVVFSPVNDVLFCSAGMDGLIVFYDLQQQKIVKKLPTEVPITSLCFHDDGVTIAAGHATGDITIFDLRAARGNKPRMTIQVRFQIIGNL